MSTATELLRRALESFDWMDVDNSVTKDIRTFLAAETEANKCQHRIADARNPVVQSGYICVDCHALFQAADHQSPKPEPEAEPVAWFEYAEHADAWFLSYRYNPNAKTKPLYLHPPRPEPSRKPMTHEEIVALFESENPDTYFADFRDSVRFAEKHHGIGGDNE